MSHSRRGKDAAIPPRRHEQLGRGRRRGHKRQDNGLACPRDSPRSIDADDSHALNRFASACLARFVCISSGVLHTPPDARTLSPAIFVQRLGGGGGKAGRVHFSAHARPFVFCPFVLFLFVRPFAQRQCPADGRFEKGLGMHELAAVDGWGWAVGPFLLPF